MPLHDLQTFRAGRIYNIFLGLIMTVRMKMSSVPFRILAFIIISIVLSSCAEDEKYIRPSNPGNHPYEQYGIPFDGVPAAGDVIMYEVNLRAFSGSGDIDGVLERIDAIDDLGVNVIWLMPIHPIGEVKSVNSPYSVR